MVPRGVEWSERDFKGDVRRVSYAWVLFGVGDLAVDVFRVFFFMLRVMGGVFLRAW